MLGTTLAGRPAARRPGGPGTWLIPIAISVTALIPRLAGLDATVTIDEPLWIERARAFYTGVTTGELSSTYQSPHPGVTTMWLAGAGLRIIPEGPGEADPYRRARVPFAVATAMGIGGIWILARRLFGITGATAGALLLSLDPFLLHHSRVVHTDAIVSLSVIAALLAFIDAMRRGRGFVTAGILTGIAVLTKGTALVLAPFLVGLLAVRDAGSVRTALSRESLAKLWRHPYARRFAAAAALTFVAAWPAVWVRPWDALPAPFLGAGRGAVLAQERNFFLGRPVRDPGPLFYPVAMAFRMTPVTLLAGVAGAAAALRRRKATGTENAAGDLRVIVWFAIVFVAVLTLGAKKLDRFALPAILALDVVAGMALAEAATRKGVSLGGRRRFTSAVVAVVLFFGHAIPGLTIAPEYLGAFNWALGGPPVARHVVLAGGGEGLQEAGTILNRLGGEKITVATTRHTGLDEAFRGQLMSMGQGTADYVVFYVSSVQTEVAPVLWARYKFRSPVAMVRIGGITKVWIWRVEPPHD